MNILKNLGLACAVASVFGCTQSKTVMTEVPRERSDLATFVETIAIDEHAQRTGIAKESLEARSEEKEDYWFVTVSEVPGYPGGDRYYTVSVDGHVEDVFNSAFLRGLSRRVGNIDSRVPED